MTPVNTGFTELPKVYVSRGIAKVISGSNFHVFRKLPDNSFWLRFSSIPKIGITIIGKLLGFFGISV